MAFVGISGSTIIQLLLRFYEPESGKITINSVDIRDYNIHYLRNIFGVISKEPVLFNGSFAENIRYNLTDISDERVRTAADEANAISFILGNEKNQTVGEKEKENVEEGFDNNFASNISKG